MIPFILNTLLVLNGIQYFNTPIEYKCLSRSSLHASSSTITEPPTTPTTTTAKHPSSEELSDIDAKVLQSLLDENIDLTSKESMQRMLQRSEAAKKLHSEETPPSPNNTKYSSKAFRNLDSQNDRDAWNSLRAKAFSVLGSAALFVANRVERDVKLMATLGVFAIERALRDVSRALPATASSNPVAKAFLQFLPEESEDTTLRDRLHTPQDEIRSVTQSVKNILAGSEAKSSTRTTLQSVAPAGFLQTKDRMKRAYRARKKVFREEKRVVALPDVGKIVDSTHEFRREMEESQPGYLTEQFRRDVGEMGNKALSGGKQTLGLLRFKKEDDHFKGELPKQMKEVSLEANGEHKQSINGDGINGNAIHADSVEIDDHHSETGVFAWTENEQNEQVIVDAQVKHINGDTITSQTQPDISTNTEFNTNLKEGRVANVAIQTTLTDQIYEPKITDTTPHPIPIQKNYAQVDTKPSLQVEVVDDEDFEKFKTVKTVSEHHESKDKAVQQQEETENLMISVTLRILDIAFYLIEKILVIGIPKIFVIGNRLITRLVQLQHNEVGYEGWKMLANVQDASKRY